MDWLCIIFPVQHDVSDLHLGEALTKLIQKRKQIILVCRIPRADFTDQRYPADGDQRMGLVADGKLIPVMGTAESNRRVCEEPGAVGLLLAAS